MRLRTRHPGLVAAACKVYGLAIWMYPSDFRGAFGHELAVTFRNRLEDVLDSGGILDWLAFAVHIAFDWMRTCVMLVTEGRTEGSASLLGLSDGDAAHGCVHRATVDAQFMFGVAGLVLTVIGWYAFFVVLPSYFR
jgi:hypothetical protein